MTLLRGCWQLAVAIVLVVATANIGTLTSSQESREVKPQLTESASSLVVKFDSPQSAGLFVGIRRFDHDESFTDVPYAVDDAIDLAYVFSLDFNMRLVEPSRIKLALSGEPQKLESRKRLDALVAAGATLHPAGRSDVLRLIEGQAQAAGSAGAFLVFFATHGFSDDDGAHHLVAADSLLRYPETTLSTSQVLDVVAQSRAARRLAFLDACRERLTRERGVIGGDLRSAASAGLAGALAQSRGLVVFFSAPTGGYAYSDHSRRNGLFAATLIDGLRCEAQIDAHGFVTVATLAAFVNNKVTDWIRLHRGHASVSRGIEVNLIGPASDLPLASCALSVPSSSQPAIVRTMDRFVNVLSETGARLWGREISGRIVGAEVADLHGDGRNEVVVGVGDGEDSGKIFVFAYDGEPLWISDTTTDNNYAGGQSGRMAVSSFVVGDLFHKGTKQIVAISIDAQGWYPSRLSILDGDGTLLASYWHPGHLQHLVLGAPTPEDLPLIVVAGVNNDLRPFFEERDSIGAVFALDPKDIHGEAPPYLGRTGRGRHLWYGIILPPPQSPIRLEILDRDQDGRDDISVWTSTGHAYYLNFEGGIIGAGSSDGAQGESRFALLDVDKD